MKIFLITTTYNNTDTLCDTLQCIQEQDHQDI